MLSVKPPSQIILYLIYYLNIYRISIIIQDEYHMFIYIIFDSRTIR